MNDTPQHNQPGDLLEDIEYPPIYSRRAIWGFSIFFTTIFGGVLLMQNLKDTGKRREANLVLLVSILITLATVVIVTVLNIKGRSVTMICNIAGAALLTEFYYKKYFPDEADYQKKKVWKPLIIAILICVAFILLAYLAQGQVG